jgi:hypothetical protein
VLADGDLRRYGAVGERQARTLEHAPARQLASVHGTGGKRRRGERR